MNWFHWVLIVFFATAPISVIANIGNQRKPLTKSDAVIGLIISAAFIVGIVHYAR